MNALEKGWGMLLKNQVKKWGNGLEKSQVRSHNTDYDQFIDRHAGKIFSMTEKIIYTNLLTPPRIFKIFYSHCFLLYPFEFSLIAFRTSTLGLNVTIRRLSMVIVSPV